MMRKLLLLVVVLALISGSLSCGTGKSDVSGTYVCTQGGTQLGGSVQGDILELSKDGTVFAYSPGGGPGVGAKWKAEGEEIIMTFEFFGMTLKGKIKGDTITLHDGSAWVLFTSSLEADQKTIQAAVNAFRGEWGYEPTYSRRGGLPPTPLASQGSVINFQELIDAKILTSIPDSASQFNYPSSRGKYTWYVYDQFGTVQFTTTTQ